MMIMWIGWLVGLLFVRSLLRSFIFFENFTVFMKFVRDVRLYKSKKLLTIERSGSKFKVKSAVLKIINVHVIARPWFEMYSLICLPADISLPEVSFGVKYDLAKFRMAILWWFSLSECSLLVEFSFHSIFTEIGKILGRHRDSSQLLTEICLWWKNEPTDYLPSGGFRRYAEYAAAYRMRPHTLLTGLDAFL